MPDSAPSFDIGSIHKLLLAAFTAEELRRFCRDRPDFSPLLARFSPHHGLENMADDVIEYCQTRLLFDQLLRDIQQENPAQYSRFRSSLRPGGEPPVATIGTGISAQERVGPPASGAPRVGTPAGGERRMVTMLFSDVKGSTAMAEDLDPEDVMDIMNGAFEVLIPPVLEHGGTLARLMGDAILAFFGAPLSHEDDAARAIRAGLDILAGARGYAVRLQREWGIRGFNVRVGINTGLVVVGEVGSDGRVEYTAMGDAVNLASRMEQNAPPGGILIAHDTYLQVRGLFDLQALEPLAVKGRTEPVRSYMVQGARPRASLWGTATRGVEGVETRMIGREGELKRLQDAFYIALEDGECQVVTVVGDAGMGKTRLLSEFENWLDEVPGSIRHLRARATPDLQGVPYSLLRDLFLLRFDIQDSDPAQTARDKLEAGIGQALGDDEEARMKAHLVGQLLGLDFGASPYVQAVRDDAQQLRNRALMYVEELLSTSAVLGAAVVLLEDIHWADDSSLDAVGSLATALARQRLLIVCLGRPTLFDRRPLWGEGQEAYTRIELQPLSRRDSRRLVDEILQKMEQVPQALRDMVVSGSEGNPLYVEELIKVLIEQQVIVHSTDGQMWSVDEARLAELRVPPTLTGVLQARLDSLPLEQRAILQQAAVVGHTFWDRVVASLAERSLDTAETTGAASRQVPDVLSTLRGRELVARHETSAFAGSQEFVFKHAALRQVAYESILKKIRRGYHSLVADWLIEQEGERAIEYVGLVAEHLELAGRTEEALGYLKQAAEQAAARFANAEAVDYYTRALALLEQLGWEPQRAADERYGLLLGREAVYDLLGRRDEQAADLATLAALASLATLAAPVELTTGASAGEEAGPAHPGRRAEVARRQSRYHESIGDYPAALASGQEAVGWAEQAADAAGLARALILCGKALWQQGQFDRARVPLEQALALARERGERAIEGSCLHHLGLVVYNQGDYQAARDYDEQALLIFREMGAAWDESVSLNSLAAVSLEVGDLERARRQLERVLAISQGMGDRRGEAFALDDLAITYEQVGDLDRARELYERALVLTRLVSDPYLEALGVYNLGCNSLGLGDAAAARQYCEQALALFRKTGQREGEGFCLTGLGFALAELGELDAAAATFGEALGLRRELGQEGAAVDDLAGLAQVASRQGRGAEALACAREALAWLAANGAAGVEYPIRDYVIAADALAAGGHSEEAAAALAAARALVQEQVARILDPKMRAAVEGIPLHARLLQQSA